jgi:hypothetical protein
LIASFSNFDGIASDESVEFFNRAGLSSQTWIDNFTNNTGDAILEMADFAESGRTLFADQSVNYSDGVARAGRKNFIIMADQINQAFVDVEKSTAETMGKIVESTTQKIVGLGDIRIAPIVVPVRFDQRGGELSPDAKAIVDALDKNTRQELETGRLVRDAA